MQKKLTIGIGTYGNTRNYIGRTLDSIIKLLKKYRYTNKTVIAIYNDDKQKSLDYITALKYMKKYPNLIICKDNCQNLGIAKTYQKMCFECDTPYFLQFDSDDIIGDFNIKQQIEFLQNNTKYCGSYGCKIIIDQQNNILGMCGDQYNIIENNFYTFNNNAMLFRVQDCKKYGFYFPQFYNEDKPLVASPDILMWIGMTIKKPMFFDKTVRTYGLQWNDGNHIRYGQKYSGQLDIINKSLRKKYGTFSDDWTLYQKQLYYSLWIQYLSPQQKVQYWQRIGNKRFQEKQIFYGYLSYLYNNHEYSKMFADMYLGIMKNSQLKQTVAYIILKTQLIEFYQTQFIDFLNNVDQRKIKQNKQWLQKFIKK